MYDWLFSIRYWPDADGSAGGSESGDADQPTPPPPPEVTTTSPVPPKPQDPDEMPDRSDELDAANASLNDALRVSFGLLKLVMLGLIIALLSTGFFVVDENTVALRVRLGELQRTAGQTPGPWYTDVRVLQQGWYFGFPEPIDNIVKVSTQNRKLMIEGFWFNEPIEDRDKPLDDETRTRAGMQLIPGQDGSLITGDRNIAHGRWSVTWYVPYDPTHPTHRYAPALWAQNVGDEQRSQQLVTMAVEQAIVEVAAQTTIDEFRRGEMDHEQVTRLAQQTLDELQTGLVVINVALEKPGVPRQTVAAFNAVNQANSLAATQIEQAGKTRTQQLFEAAGPGWPQLLQRIEAYEQAMLVDEPQAIEQARDALAEVFTDPQVAEQLQVSGEVASIVSEAEAYVNELDRQLRTEVELVELLAEQYRNNPEMKMRIKLYETIAEVFAQAHEKFVLTNDADKTLYLEINPNPEFERQRQVEALQSPDNN